MTHHRLEINGLANEFLLTKGVAGLRCDGIHRSLVNLLFHSSKQHKQWLTGTFSQELVEKECKPCRQHFLSYTLCPD